MPQKTLIYVTAWLLKFLWYLQACWRGYFLLAIHFNMDHNHVFIDYANIKLYYLKHIFLAYCLVLQPSHIAGNEKIVILSCT